MTNDYAYELIDKRTRSFFLSLYISQRINLFFNLHIKHIHNRNKLIQ